jgi:hypothetical protein
VLTGSELKRRQKERERTAQKAAKAAAAPPVAQKKTSAAAAEDELDPSVSYLSSFALRQADNLGILREPIPNH